jgi:hypothetical protein
MNSRVSRQSMTDLMLWPVLAAVFVAWPFLSAFPIFAIVAHEKTFVYVTVQLLFLATGFWTPAAVLAFTAWTVQDGAWADFRRALSGKIGPLAWYGFAWCTLYMFVSAFAPI